MTDIVERLRAHGSKTEMEAADAIERLRAENMELRAERLLLQSWMLRSRQGAGDEK
jgi:hypothetical protein